MLRATISAFILAIIMSGCTKMPETQTANNHNFKCIDGVKYVIYDRGISVMFNQDSTVAKCS